MELRLLNWLPQSSCRSDCLQNSKNNSGSEISKQNYKWLFCGCGSASMTTSTLHGFIKVHILLIDSGLGFDVLWDRSVTPLDTGAERTIYSRVYYLYTVVYYYQSARPDVDELPRYRMQLAS
jgi:hypothetical protein